MQRSSPHEVCAEKPTSNSLGPACQVPPMVWTKKLEGPRPCSLAPAITPRELLVLIQTTVLQFKFLPQPHVEL